MKILFLLTIDLNSSGPSVHLLNDIVKCAEEKGHSFDIIQKKYGDENEWNVNKTEKNSSKIFSVSCRRPQGLPYVKRYLDELKYASIASKIYKNEKYDLVFLQSCNTAYFHCKRVKRHLKCPICYNVQDIFPLDLAIEGTLFKHNPMYMFFNWTQKKAYMLSDKVITISEDMKNTLISIFRKINVEVIYNWEFVNTFNQEDMDYVKQNYFPGEYFYVVYAGNIGIAQSVETIIKAAKKIEDIENIKFVIIGNGSKKKSILKYAEELNVNNVVFYDMLPQKLSKYIYKASSLNIVSLKKGIIKTSLPSKTATCFNARRPFIYFYEPDDEISKVLSKNHFLISCEPDDPVALAEKILEASNKVFGNICSPNFSDVVKKNSPMDYIDCFEEIYKGV